MRITLTSAVTNKRISLDLKRLRNAEIAEFEHTTLITFYGERNQITTEVKESFEVITKKIKNAEYDQGYSYPGTYRL